MTKKRYNAKARQVVKTNIDDSQTNEIKLDFNTNDYGSSDPSNVLALPSQKRKTKVILDKKEKTRLLSKAQRKRLEKIVEKKKKKENRAALLESLSHVQATTDEMRQLTTIASVQTMGLRKLNEMSEFPALNQDAGTKDDGNKKFSSIAGAKRRLRLLRMDAGDVKKKAKYDPNVVGLEESSTEDSEESESDAEEITEKEQPETQEVTIEVEEAVDTNEKEGIIIIDDDKQNSKTKTKNKITEPEPIEIKEEKPVLECPKAHVEVKRDPKVQVARLKLPILGEEQRIMELINENEILIVAGETGSGKTTQIPQFLYEAGYAEKRLIGVTEPRRVATVAMSARVGHELGMTKEVSYLMRFEGNVTSDTKIKFMTDGVLLKEIQTDFLLSKYSVIIIDEAHERSVYTDILLGLLSRIVPLRRKRGSVLRLIVMSATLRVEDFTENKRLFKSPPPVVNDSWRYLKSCQDHVLENADFHETTGHTNLARKPEIDSRQYPVTIHFNKHTYSDYLKEAYRKAVKIHTRLPDGGILIFVTGQQEVNYLVRKLKSAFPYRKDVDYSKIIKKKRTLNEGEAALDSDPEDLESDDDEVEKEMKRARKARKKAKLKLKSLPKINLDDYDLPADDAQADLVDDESDGHLSDSDQEDTLAPSIKACRQPLWVLPLYSMLPAHKQYRIFNSVPVGARVCVVSTDVAETSLTIPDIRYVVDTGKKKIKIYDHTTGASTWRVVWTSAASANQRAGRAGRTGAGHAYRLYSTAVFQHDCPEQYPPDICRQPADQVVLSMKCMGIAKVVNFPFPSAPDRLALRLAEKRLVILGMLQKPEVSSKRKDEEEVLQVTPLGRAVSAFPLLPRYGKMLALSHQYDLLPYSIIMVAALSVPEVMSGKPDSWPATGNILLLGDVGVLLRAVGAADYALVKGEEELFCAKYGLREKAIIEIRKLRKQLTNEINLSVPGVDLNFGDELKPIDDVQAKLLRQLVLSGLGDQVARKIALNEVKEGEDKRKYKYAYHCTDLEEPVHLHSNSILRKTIPEWVVYQEIYETGDVTKKMIMRNVTAIEPEWLPLFVPELCNLGEPLTDPEPRYDEATGKVKCHFQGTFGKQGWELPVVEIDFPDKIDRYKWFARFLLEGAIFPKLKKYSNSLLSPPSTMIKSWAKLQPRTEVMLKALLLKRAGTKEALKAVWRDQNQYLLNEYLKWLPESAHNEVSLLWPPL